MGFKKYQSFSAEHVEYLKSIFDYRPISGEFYLKKDLPYNRKKGTKTGFKSSGYIVVRLDGIQYLGHRLAWAIHNGYWPDGMIDHINGNRTDNRISNLREVTSRINQNNFKRHRDGLLVGATKSGSKWICKINVDGKQVFLGTFDSEKEAHEEYLLASKMVRIFSKISGRDKHEQKH